jgi:hypothetical protein
VSERSDMSACGLLFKINEYIGSISGADPGFQVRGRGGHLKKLRRAERGAKMFGVFRVKNHDFTPKNLIFSNSPPPPPPPPLDPPLNLHDSNKLNLFMVRICLV